MNISVRNNKTFIAGGTRAVKGSSLVVGSLDETEDSTTGSKIFLSSYM